MAESTPEAAASGGMVERITECDYAKVIEMADDLMGKGETVVLYFTGKVDEKTKKNWCSDCVKSSPIVEDFLKTTKFTKKIHVIEIPICKDSMKDKNNQWKINKDIMLKNVPTMILWKGSKDVRDKQMMKKDMLKMLLEEFIEK
uniref:Thioredoxin domain-containing protein 17 n=1 Tax=Lygus hesperus TaxID=30085 RepID=A0A0A9X1H2_LYGHE